MLHLLLVADLVLLGLLVPLLAFLVRKGLVLRRDASLKWTGAKLLVNRQHGHSKTGWVSGEEPILILIRHSRLLA